MFSRKYRLPATIRLEHSKIIHTPLFSLRIAKNNLVYNRYGFIVSKKIDKRATVRNRLKRRFRACVEQMHKQLATGRDFLFVLKKEAVEMDTNVLCDKISLVLR